MTAVAPPTLRRATAADAAALARFAERTFRDAFAAANRREDMDAYCGESFGEAVQAREIADPRLETFLALEGSTLVAFAQLAWGEPPPSVDGRRPVEVRRVYVDAAWQGHGLARTLMEALLARAAAAGADVVWLGVWERNPRAIAFYRKHGFVEVGDHVFLLGSDAQRDLVMARRLG